CCGSWTPDGRYYVFQALRNGGSDIWILPDRSSLFRKKQNQPLQLTTGPLFFSAPVPSKDGKKLFVIGAQPRAELVRYDSTSREFVPYLGGISAVGIDFSHHGKRGAYLNYPYRSLCRCKLYGSGRLPPTYS